MQVAAQKCQSVRSGTISVGGAHIARSLYLTKYDLLIFEKRVVSSEPYKKVTRSWNANFTLFFFYSFIAEVFHLISC